MTRKLLMGFLALVLAVSVLAVCAMTAEALGPEVAAPADAVTARVVDRGSCGDDLQWELTDDGTLTISGTGEMRNSTWAITPWMRVKSKITSIVIEEGVTSIGEYAFPCFSNVTSVTMPNSLTSIGDVAFYECTGLTSLTIPDSVTSIGVRAFYNCTGLTSLTIPSSGINIGAYAFLGCTGLADGQGFVIVNKILFDYTQDAAKVVIPDGVIRIGESALNSCSMTDITIPDSVKSIGASAFAGCEELRSITIPNGVTTIALYTFNDCSALASVSIPDSVKSIEMGAFYMCSGLTSVVIPNSVKTIGIGAFMDCENLTSVVIGSGVELIEKQAFCGDTKLTSFTVGTPNAELTQAYIGLDYQQNTAKDSVIYGYSGSTAQSYADSKGIQFVPISAWSVKNGTGYHQYPVVPEKSNTTYKLKSNGSVTVYTTGLLRQFVRLLVDGKAVASGDYQIKEGSTILTLPSAFLNTLSPGNHTVTLEYANGTAETTVTIQKSETATEPTTPATKPPAETVPPTKPTEAATEPSTEPSVATEPSTEPSAATEPSTEPSTEAVTQPPAETIPEPSTEPSTEPSNAPTDDPTAGASDENETTDNPKSGSGWVWGVVLALVPALGGTAAFLYFRKKK